jgi:hypothetical protein
MSAFIGVEAQSLALSYPIVLGGQGSGSWPREGGPFRAGVSLRGIGAQEERAAATGCGVDQFGWDFDWIG